MSNAVLKGNASGTGTVTLETPNTNSDRTISLPDADGSMVYANTSGNVGIGTASPNQKLAIASGAGVGASIEMAGNGNTLGTSSMFVGQGSAGDAYVWQRNSTQPLVFATNNTERMRIDSSGIVQIGTTATNPAPSNTYGIVLGVDGSGNAYAGAAQFSANGSAAIVLNRGSDDGTTMAFRRTGTQVGAINVTSSSTSYVTSSDYRLKENVAAMTEALAKVTQLKPCTYKWKATGEYGQGFIAHELQAVVPDCVTGEKDAVDEEGKPVYQGIDTSFLVATLTAAIQELNAKVDAQALEIQALKGVA